MMILAPGKSTNIINDGCQVNLNFDFCKIIAVHRQFADWIGAEIKKLIVLFGRGESVLIKWIFPGWFNEIFPWDIWMQSEPYY